MPQVSNNEYLNTEPNPNLRVFETVELTRTSDSFSQEGATATSRFLNPVYRKSRHGETSPILFEI